MYLWRIENVRGAVIDDLIPAISTLLQITDGARNKHLESIYVIGKCWLIAWLVADHTLLRDFGPRRIIL
jgi:hypothetical protein